MRNSVSEEEAARVSSKFIPQTGGDLLVDVLIEWGVEVVFGLPGDGINGIMEALRQRQGEIQFIQVRHEESAAFMAVGYAKTTGRLGVCLATSGPGGIHLLNGLYDAKLDGVPVLAITGLHFHDLLSTYAQQDVELDKLFEDVSIYNARIMGPAHVENIVSLACRSAIGRRGVAHVTMPVDFQSEKTNQDVRSDRNVKNHVSYAHPNFGRVPEKKDLLRAAEILNEGRKVAILAGQGALGCADELTAIAAKLGAPIVKALLGKACVPDDSIYTTGGIGLLGTRPSEDAMQECDRLLIVGSSFPYIEFYPQPGSTKSVQIDADYSRIGLRYPVNVGLVGDSKKTLQELLAMLVYNENRAFLQKAQNGMIKWWDLMKERGERSDYPMKPQVVAWEIGKRLKDDAIVISDSGTVAAWFARHIPTKKGQIHTLSGNLATMACGLTYAIGSQVAHPGRQCVAFVGDGGLSMLMAELATCVKYQLPVKVVVIKNNSLAQIKWEQMVFLGNPEYGCELQPIDFTKVADGCGVKSFRIEEAKYCGNILDEALNFPGPALIEAVVDPNEPPMPSKIKPKQAFHFAESLVRGTRNRNKIFTTAIKDKIRELS